jgi:hypothetical protein
MDERTTYPYRGYTISTFQEEGVWWATARPVEKEAGGDEAIVGGPWRSQHDARSAAQVFCDSQPARPMPPASA